MVKLSRPTPKQARIMREMFHENRCVHAVFSAYPQGELKSINCESFKEKFAVATFQVMFMNKWIIPDKERLISMGGKDLVPFCLSEIGKDALNGLCEEDFVTQNRPAPIWNADDILKALIYRYKKLNEGDDVPKYIYFEELLQATGDPRGKRRLDLWLLNTWPSSEFEATTFEIKISRQDFRHELENPAKRQFGLDVSNYFYFVAPNGMIKDEEVPLDCGLIEYYIDGRLKEKKKAPRREKRNPGWAFFASICRRKFVEERK